MKTARRILLAAFLLWGIFRLGYSIAAYNPIVHPLSSDDLLKTCQGVLLWQKTGDYSRVSECTANLYYPPLYYVTLLPFMKLGFKPMAALFYFLQFPLFFLATRWLVRAASSRPTPSIPEYWIAVALIANFRPFAEALSYHKVDSVVFALICLALYLLRKKKESWAGSAVALGAMLKYFPAVLAVYFLLRRKTKVLLGIFMTVTATFLLLGFFLKPKELWSIGVLHPASMASNSRILYAYHPGVFSDWQSLGDAIMKWFYRPAGTTFQRQLITGKFPRPVYPELAALLVSSAKAFFFLGYLIVIIPQRKWHRTQGDAAWPLVLLEVSLTLLLLPILLQGFRYHYALMLLPAFLSVALMLYGNGPLFRLKEKILFVLSYGLSGMPIPGGLLNSLLPPNPIWGREYALLYTWLSLPVYGFLLLFVCILLCRKRLGQQVAAE